MTAARARPHKGLRQLISETLTNPDPKPETPKPLNPKPQSLSPCSPWLRDLGGGASKVTGPGRAVAPKTSKVFWGFGGFGFGVYKGLVQGLGILGSGFWAWGVFDDWCRTKVTCSWVRALGLGTRLERFAS